MSKSQNRIFQEQSLDEAKSQKVTGNVIIPGEVISADISLSEALVGKGNLVRIRVTAITYVAFSDDSMAAVTSATSPAVELDVGTHLVAATGELIRASSNPARVEVIDDIV